jgi:hypothetical protein
MTNDENLPWSFVLRRVKSCIFIHGLQPNDPASVRLITLVSPDLVPVIPRLVA